MKRLIISLLAIISLPVSAERASMDTQVERIFVDSTGFGYCAIKLADGIRSSTGLDCGGTFVTFSCDGEHIPKDVAYKMLDLAQMAFALDRRITVFIEDTKKSAGLCLADRIVVL